MRFTRVEFKKGWRKQSGLHSSLPGSGLARRSGWAWMGWAGPGLARLGRVGSRVRLMGVDAVDVGGSKAT